VTCSQERSRAAVTTQAFTSSRPLQQIQTARASLGQVVSATLLHSKGLIAISLKRRVRFIISKNNGFPSPIQKPK